MPGQNVDTFSDFLAMGLSMGQYIIIQKLINQIQVLIKTIGYLPLSASAKSGL